jgi:hypothetical protein
MTEELTLKSYEYLMQDTYNRIELKKHYDLDFKPYTKKFLKKTMKHFEYKEEYEKCKVIHDFISSRFNHELNFNNI